MSKFTVLVQGPLHSNSILSLFHYLSVGDVVISCWSKVDQIKLEDGTMNPTKEINNYVEKFHKFYTPKLKRKVTMVTSKSQLS